MTAAGYYDSGVGLSTRQVQLLIFLVYTSQGHFTLDTKTSDLCFTVKLDYLPFTFYFIDFLTAARVQQCKRVSVLFDERWEVN